MISKKQVLDEANVSHLNYVPGQYAIIQVEWRQYVQRTHSVSRSLKDVRQAIEEAGDLLYSQIQNEYSVLANN